MTPEWTPTQLGQVGRWLSGGTPSLESPEYWGGSVPWASAKDMKRFELWDTDDHITEKGLAKGSRAVEAGNLLLVVRGMILAHTFPVAIAMTRMAFNQDIKAIRCQPHVDPRFMAHWLVGSSARILTKVTDTSHGTKRFDVRHLQRHPLLLPPHDEQQMIARILDAADIAIERTRTSIATAERLKRGLMQQALKRCSKSKAPIERLDKVAEIGSGVTLGRDLSGSATVELPYLRVANVQDGFLDLEEIKTVKVRLSEVERFSLAEGDVLLTEGGDFDKLGRGAVWTGEISPCLHQNHIFRVRADRTKLEPHFLATLTGSEYGKRFFLRIAKRTTNLASINKTQLKSFPVILPNLKEQERIVCLIASVNRLIESNEARRRSFEKLKRGLMQDLLTGRVRVKLPAHSGNGVVRSRP